MTVRTWNGLSQGGYEDAANWLNGAPAIGDTGVIDGSAGETPSSLDGSFLLGNDALIQLYDPSVVPVLIGDPDPSEVPVAAPVSGLTLDVEGGAAIVGLGMVDASLAADTTVNVTGNALMRGFYTNTLAGVINVEQTAGAALNAHANNGELDITVYPSGSIDPNTETTRAYTPIVENTGTIDIGSGSGLRLGFAGGPVTFNNLDGIEQALGGNDAFVNTGVIDLQDSALDVLGGFSAGDQGFNIFLNDGTIDLGPTGPGGSALFDAEVNGTGTISLVGDGAARAGATFTGSDDGNTISVADADVAFTANNPAATYPFSGAFVFADNAGHLTLNGNVPQPFLPISGFSAGDQITVNSIFAFSPDSFDNNLIATPTVSWDQATQQLTLGYTNLDGSLSGTVYTLTLKGSYQQSDFSVVASGGSGTAGDPGYVEPNVLLTTDTLACFLAGTAILTADGERAVETLAVGDLVATASGRGAPCKPIRWIGRSRFDARRHISPEEVYPIRIRAGAFAEAVPHRDLLVSPGHAIMLDGVLTQASRLVNGASVLRDKTIAQGDYFHVELDEHDLLISEGLASESFRETGLRRNFVPIGPVTRLHPAHGTEPCVALVEDGPVLQALRGKVIERAATLGWIGRQPPDLVALCGQALEEPVARAGRMIAFDIRQAGEIRLVSASGVPGELTASGTDWRRLGVWIEAITIVTPAGRQPIPLDGAALADGWHAPERDGDAVWRWTNGNAGLVVTQAGRLEITLGGGLPCGTSRSLARAVDDARTSPHARTAEQTPLAA